MMRTIGFAACCAMTVLAGSVHAAAVECSAVKAEIERKYASDEPMETLLWVNSVYTCDSEHLRALTANMNALRDGDAVTDVADLEGTWLNDNWFAEERFLSLAVAEVLSIDAGGRLERIAFRWDDPRAQNYGEIDSEESAPAPLPDLTPILLTGTVTSAEDGTFLLENIERDETVELALGKRTDPAAYVLREAMVRAKMPALDKPFTARRTYDALIVGDADGRLVTYRRVDEADIVRAHAIHAVGSFRVDLTFRCVMDQLAGSSPSADELRAAGDDALATLQAEKQLHLLDREFAEFGADEMSDETKQRREALLDETAATKAGNTAAWLQEQMKSDDAFGCKG